MSYFQVSKCYADKHILNGWLLEICVQITNLFRKKADKLSTIRRAGADCFSGIARGKHEISMRSQHSVADLSSVIVMHYLKNYLR